MGEISYKTIRELLSTDRNIMENAFNSIYNKYASLVYYVSFDILKSKEDAEDIVNETFLKMYASRASIKSDKSLKYLLLTISKNLSINLFNKKIKMRPLEVEVASNDLVVDEFSEFKNKYKDVLNEEELSIVMDHLIADYSFREIAEKYSSSTNAISSKYRRAIEKLKKHYKE